MTTIDALEAAIDVYEDEMFGYDPDSLEVLKLLRALQQHLPELLQLEEHYNDTQGDARWEAQ